MISTGSIILTGVLGIVTLVVFFFLVLFYSRRRTPVGSKNKTISPREKARTSKKTVSIGKRTLGRSDPKRPPYYGMIKDYYLTYLECCYGAFITVFIGILAVPVLPISNLVLKLATICGFWFVGGYYLAQIIYTYGQLKVVFGYLDVDDVISKDVEKLGFPFDLLEKVFKCARKPVYGRANMKYFVVGFGYLGFLGISIVACLNL